MEEGETPIRGRYAGMCEIYLYCVRVNRLSSKRHEVIYVNAVVAIVSSIRLYRLSVCSIISLTR